MANTPATVIESQVDWLTVSAHGTDRAHGLAWLAHEWAQAEKSAENKLRKWNLAGYTGQMVGRVRWGQRDEHATLVQLSGQLAEDHLDELVELCDGITRVDLAVTVRTAEPDPHVGPNAYLLGTWHNRDHPNSALTWRVTDARKGETVYIGKRESDYFARLYNKEQECISNDDAPGALRYANCWRYELECKGLAAPTIALSAHSAPNRSSYCQGAVHSFYAGHGVEPIFRPDGERVLLPGFRRRSDAESRLRHLGRNVKPTIDWLREAGRLSDALAVLGLAELDDTAPERA